MSGRLQAAAALALAVGLHLAAFALREAPVGAVSSGAGGEDLVSLQAANASIAEMVEAWDKPPELAAVPEVAPPQPVPQPVQPPQMPDRPAIADAPPVLPQPVAPMALPTVAEALPQADVSLPPPVVAEPAYEPAPMVDVRPPPRPEPQKKSAPAPKKPAKKAAPSAGQAAQRASGSGNGAQAGAGGASAAATLSKSAVNNLRASWGASIRTRVERRKTYPSAARGASGTVTVRLAVSRAGQLQAVSVAKSSGNAALDQAALNAVKAARSFPAAPKGLTESSYSFNLPMRFSR